MGRPSTDARVVHRVRLGLSVPVCRRFARSVPTTTELGIQGERIAAAFLARAGLHVLDRNWRCRDGELDLVARDGDALVFCEVKTRPGPATAIRWRR